MTYVCNFCYHKQLHIEQQSFRRLIVVCFLSLHILYFFSYFNKYLLIWLDMSLKSASLSKCPAIYEQFKPTILSRSVLYAANAPLTLFCLRDTLRDDPLGSPLSQTVPSRTIIPQGKKKHPKVGLCLSS